MVMKVGNEGGIGGVGVAIRKVVILMNLERISGIQVENRSWEFFGIICPIHTPLIGPCIHSCIGTGTGDIAAAYATIEDTIPVIDWIGVGAGSAHGNGGLQHTIGDGNAV